MQRIQARDFYDLWYLLEQHGMDVDFFRGEFESKCKSKGINSTHSVYQIFANACSKSALMSSMFSIPTEIRTRPGSTPEAF